MADGRGSPVVQIFADSEAALVRMSQTAKTAECRVAAAQLIEEQMDRSARAVPGGTLLIELEDEQAAEAAVLLLDWARQEAERGARRCVVSGPPALIDLIAARVGHADIQHLCDASEEERLAAVVHATRPREARLHDSGREASRLLQPSPGYAVASAGRADAVLIRKLIRARRLRTRFFQPDLFADPAWDMLLDLMAARLEGKQVAVSSLCIAAAVPPTTALRWIGVLVEEGLVVRVPDPVDGRRVHVALAEPAAQALGAWLHEARRSLGETA